MSFMKRVSVAAIFLASAAACGASQHGGADSELNCGELATSARSDIDSAVKQNVTCTEDADCVAVDAASGCTESCGAAVNAAGVAAVKAAVDRANKGVCATFKDKECYVERLPCAAPPTPRCIDGSCG